MVSFHHTDRHLSFYGHPYVHSPRVHFRPRIIYRHAIKYRGRRQDQRPGRLYINNNVHVGFFIFVVVRLRRPLVAQSLPRRSQRHPIRPTKLPPTAPGRSDYWHTACGTLYRILRTQRHSVSLPAAFLAYQLLRTRALRRPSERPTCLSHRPHRFRSPSILYNFRSTPGQIIDGQRLHLLFTSSNTNSLNE